MSKTIREIRIYPSNNDFVVSKIILNQQQFLILKESLDNTGDKDYAYVYPVTLEHCIYANINIPSEYREGDFEFYLHTYKES